MAKKRAKSETTSASGGREFKWNDDDFNLDSFGVEAPADPKYGRSR